MNNKVFFWWLIFPALVIIVILVYLSFAWAQLEGGDVPVHPAHPMDWIAKYTGKKGWGCCGHQDCLPVHLHIVEDRGDMVDVEVIFKNPQKGSFIFKDFPRKAFHVSEDENDYYCFVPFNHSYPTGRSAADDECARNPNQECPHCLFWAPKM